MWKCVSDFKQAIELWTEGQIVKSISKDGTTYEYDISKTNGYLETINGNSVHVYEVKSSAWYVYED